MPEQVTSSSAKDTGQPKVTATKTSRTGFTGSSERGHFWKGVTKISAWRWIAKQFYRLLRWISILMRMPVFLLALPLVFGLLVKYHHSGASVSVSDPDLGKVRLLHVIPHPWANAGIAHAGMPSHAVFSESGTYFATAGHADGIKVWDGKTGKLLARIEIPTVPVSDALPQITGAVPRLGGQENTLQSSSNILGLAISEPGAGLNAVADVRIAVRWLQHVNQTGTIHIGVSRVAPAALNAGPGKLALSKMLPPAEGSFQGGYVPLDSLTLSGISQGHHFLAWLPSGELVYVDEGSIKHSRAGTRDSRTDLARLQIMDLPDGAFGSTYFQISTPRTLTLGQRAVTAFATDKAGDIHLGFSDGRVATATIVDGQASWQLNWHDGLPSDGDQVSDAIVVDPTLGLQPVPRNAEPQSVNPIFTNRNLSADSNELKSAIQNRAQQPAVSNRGSVVESTSVNPAVTEQDLLADDSGNTRTTRETGQQSSVPKPERPITALEVTGTNALYSTAADGTVTRWRGNDAVELKTIHVSSVLKGHDSSAWHAAFSSDGTRIVTASEDNTARLWNGQTGQQIAVLTGHENTVWHAAFSSDGTRIVTASSDNTARLWDGQTGQQIAVLTGHENTVWHAAFSSDGTRIVTASNDMTARLWDGQTGQQIAVLKGHLDALRHSVFSRDGTRIVTASWDQTARLWDGWTGQQIAVLKGHENTLWHAAFSSDGTRIVTASWDNTARLWDGQTGQQIIVLTGHENTVWHAAFSSDGTRIVTASSDNTARLWDGRTGHQIAILKGHKESVDHVAFSSDGTRIVTASGDNTARLWDGQTGRQITVLNGHDGNVSHAVFNSDGTRIVTASNDTTARLWDISALTCHTCTSLAVAPGKEVFAVAGDSKNIAIRNILDGRRSQAFEHLHSVVYTFITANERMLVTIDDDAVTRLWELSTGRLIGRIAGHGHHIANAVISPDGTRLLTVDFAGRALLSDLSRHQMIYSIDVARWISEIIETSSHNFSTWLRTLWHESR